MITIKINSENDLPKVAREFLNQVGKRKIFAFYGDMGAGKTTFIKSLCTAMGVEDIINSPSFAIVNEYETVDQESIFHFDLYRVNKAEEVYDFGYEEYLYGGSYCFIEWPQIVESLLPDDTVRVDIKVEDNGHRIVEIDIDYFKM